MFLFFNIFFSRFLKDTLQRYKVNTENCVTCTNGLKTPTSIVITNKQNGSRTILHHGKLVKLCQLLI
jgi:sugar/nucleoside kinase (ribokinase family)